MRRPLIGIACDAKDIAGHSFHAVGEKYINAIAHGSQTLPREQQYGPAHSVRLTRGGVLAELLRAEEALVTSLHGQGVDRLASGLRVEATAMPPMRRYSTSARNPPMPSRMSASTAKLNARASRLAMASRISTWRSTS